MVVLLEVKLKNNTCDSISSMNLPRFELVCPVGALLMGFPRQESWSGLPFPSPGDPPNPGVKPTSPILQIDSLLLDHEGCLGSTRTRTQIIMAPNTAYHLLTLLTSLYSVLKGNTDSGHVR